MGIKRKEDIQMIEEQRQRRFKAANLYKIGNASKVGYRKGEKKE